MEFPVPSLEESWKQTFLQYDSSGSSHCTSLSPSHNWLLEFTVQLLRILCRGFEVVDDSVRWLYF